jgi:hypothetical protein
MTLLEGLRKPLKTSVRIVGLRAEICFKYILISPPIKLVIICVVYLPCFHKAM